MKLFVFAFLLFCALAAVQGVPAQRKKQPKCHEICAANYDPVCAADPKDSKTRPRLFSNTCTLNRHNCENDSALVEVDMVKCQKVGGIRLS